MSYGNTTTLVGNLADDPELRYTGSGIAVAGFVVMVNARRFDRQQGRYVDGDVLSMRCTAWRDLGEHVAESFRQGHRVMVTGRLRQHTYQDKDGNTRWATDLTADDVAGSVRFVNIKVLAPDRPNGAAEPSPWDSTPPGIDGQQTTPPDDADQAPPF